jgi:hypothetical protein
VARYLQTQRADVEATRFGEATMKARNTLITAASAFAMALIAAPAAAQVCSGYPTLPGQTSIGLRASFPTGGTSIGIEASRNWQNPLGVFANLNLLMPDDDDLDNQTVAGLGFAYEVGDLLPTPAWLGICPVAAVTIQGGDATTLTFPLGVGFGTSFDLTEGIGLKPFIIPQFVLTRISVDDVTVSDHNFGFGAGAFATFGGVYGGVTLGKIMASGHDVTIGFQGGLLFPAMR